MSWLDNLRELKASSGMTTKELSRASSIPEPTLEKILSGQTKNPGVNSIQSVVHAMGFTLNDIDPKMKNATTDVDSGEERLLGYYRTFNEEGRERLIETADDMARSGKYIKSNPHQLRKEA